MERLIEKVIVLKSTDYVERGWCLYEYIVASLKVTFVCDEVRDSDFVQLRQWSSMRAPASDSLRGHSFESSIQNSIDENILDIVNRILAHLPEIRVHQTERSRLGHGPSH